MYKVEVLTLDELVRECIATRESLVQMSSLIPKIRPDYLEQDSLEKEHVLSVLNSTIVSKKLYEKIVRCLPKSGSGAAMRSFWRNFDKKLQRALIEKIYEEDKIRKNKVPYYMIVAYSELIPMRVVDQIVKHSKTGYIPRSLYYLSRIFELQEMYGYEKGNELFRTGIY